MCVFCGSRLWNNPLYKTITEELWKELARRWNTLIYGWWSAGLMWVVADGVLSERWFAIGIFPRFLEKKEISHKSWVDLTYVDTMDERKVIMYGQSDGSIIIPWWFWTMDEFFEVLTLRQIWQYDKPIGILNIDWYYDPMIEFIHHMVERGFVSVEHLELFFVRDNIGDLLDAMEL